MLREKSSSAAIAIAAAMSTKKLGVWVNALMTRFEEQLPCRNGPQTHHTRINTQQNKESIIHISKWKFTLVISGLTKILTKINEMRPHPQIPELERDYYESLYIVLDTLEKCLSSPAGAESPKYDDTMNVKMLLKEICPFLDMPGAAIGEGGCGAAASSSMSAAALAQPTCSQQVLQIRQLAAKVVV